MSQNFFFKDSIAEAIALTVTDSDGLLNSDSSMVSVTGTGGTITYNLDGVVSNHSVNTSAKYWVGGGTTMLGGLDAAGNTFQVFINGTIGGPYSCGNMYYQDNTGKQWGAGGSIGGSCNIAITNYGAVGELINGTFSGSLVAQFGGATGSKSITNGSFSVYREPNQ